MKSFFRYFAEKIEDIEEKALNLGNKSATPGYNQAIILAGAAGSGKSILSLGFLFQELDKGHIDKIIIFCNTVATRNSAKLGYYPGTRDEKLLDSQIGNFLRSKFGDRQ